LILCPIFSILFSMRKTILLYGIAMALLLALLKIIEYQFVVRDLSLEATVGLLAVFFTGIGIWAGLASYNVEDRCAKSGLQA
jgi:hypothetical protein